MPTSQFRRVSRIGERKAMPRGEQFRAVTNHAFVKEAPKPPSREGRCVAKDDTCKGFRAKGTEYCAGHLRSMGLLDGEEVTDEEGPTGNSDQDTA